MTFKNRKEAGELLAKELLEYKSRRDLLVLGIPRGGVVVAKEIADELKIPLDIVVTRKIGHPLNPEFAIAAVDEDEAVTQDDAAFGLSEVSQDFIHEEAKAQASEIKRRLTKYRGDSTHADFKGKLCLIVDDGIATGLTTIAAINFVKRKGAKEVILATPVIPIDKIDTMAKKVDKLFYLNAPEIFFAVGQFYEDFPQTTDEEVVELLKTI